LFPRGSLSASSRGSGGLSGSPFPPAPAAALRAPFRHPRACHRAPSKGAAWGRVYPNAPPLAVWHSRTAGTGDLSGQSFQSLGHSMSEQPAVRALQPAEAGAWLVHVDQRPTADGVFIQNTGAHKPCCTPGCTLARHNNACCSVLYCCRQCEKENLELEPTSPHGRLCEGRLFTREAPPYVDTAVVGPPWHGPPGSTV
jgi:hypothetical protein